MASSAPVFPVPLTCPSAEGMGRGSWFLWFATSEVLKLGFYESTPTSCKYTFSTVLACFSIDHPGVCWVITLV